MRELRGRRFGTTSLKVMVFLKCERKGCTKKLEVLVELWPSSGKIRIKRGRIEFASKDKKLRSKLWERGRRS